MVLGVDDFNQEFAYLSGRDQWIVRDLIGYGTVCGLHVTKEPDSGDGRGPRVIVAPGVAVNPRGQMIHVTLKQCAVLNAWLALPANKQQLASLIGSPLNGAVTLYVVLCYRECPTDQVPIPGQPCRSADEAMAASRLTDDFKLELRYYPPDQHEEDAIRDFVVWLSQVEVSNTSSTTLDEFEAAIRAAAQLSSPLASPLDFMFGSPPSSLTIPAAMACTYWRAAFRIWTTELQPIWLASGKSCSEVPDEDCVLLAELDVPIIQGLTGDWQVDSTRDIVVVEERRPYLLPLRLLQEWLLCGVAEVAVHSASEISGSVVAAGRFDATGATLFSHNGLSAIRFGPAQNLYFLSFNGFSSTASYIVKGTPLTSLSIQGPSTFEIIPANDAGLPPLLAQIGQSPGNGIIVRVMQTGGQPVSTGFMVDISQY